jgi:hypothetical protein
MMHHRAKLALRWIGGVFAVFLISYLVRASLSGPPFRMTIRPVNGGAEVQFSRPELGLVSPTFAVDLAIQQPVHVVLRERAPKIPGVTIEFKDITFLPGRFIMRVGKTQFDVMQAAIVVDEEQFLWQRDGETGHEAESRVR